MTKEERSPFRLARSASLPGEVDFDPLGGCLDAQCAWRHFGGKSLREAYDLLSTKPIHFLEDFMWMGPSAFTYYFPVIDGFVREVVGDPEQEIEVASAGAAVGAQFDGPQGRFLDSLVEEVEQLLEFVALHYRRYVPPSKGHRSILRAVEEAAKRVAEYKSQA